MGSSIIIFTLLALSNLASDNLVGISNNDLSHNTFHVFVDSIDVKVVKIVDTNNFQIRIINYNKHPLYIDADHFFWGDSRQVTDTMHFCSIRNDADSYPTEDGTLLIRKIKFRDTLIINLKSPNSLSISYPKKYFELTICFYLEDDSFLIDKNSIKASNFLWLLNRCITISNF